MRSRLPALTRSLSSISRLPPPAATTESGGAQCSGWNVASGLRRPVKRVNHAVSAARKEVFASAGFVVLDCALPAPELDSARAAADAAAGAAAGSGGGGTTLLALPPRALASDTFAAVCFALLGGAPLPDAPPTPQPGNLPPRAIGGDAAAALAADVGDVWLRAPALHLPPGGHSAGDTGGDAETAATAAGAGGSGSRAISCCCLLDGGGVALSEQDAAMSVEGAAVAGALRRAGAGSLVVAQPGFGASFGGVAALAARGGVRSLSCTFVLSEHGSGSGGGGGGGGGGGDESSESDELRGGGGDNEGGGGLHFLSDGTLHADAVALRGHEAALFAGHGAFAEQRSAIPEQTAAQLAAFSKFRA